MKPNPDELIRQVVDIVKHRLPPGLDDVSQDIRQHLRASLSETLASLDMVTREEFDVQQKVLARTRAKLDALEARCTELEALLQQETLLQQKEET